MFSAGHIAGQKMASITCPLCPTLCCNSFREYLQHVQLMHSSLPNFSITCGIGGCLRTFRKMGPFRNHISAYHSKSDLSTISTDTSRITESEESTSYNNEDDDLDNSSEIDPQIALKSYVARFLLQLKEKQKLTQVAVQSVIEGVTSLVQFHLNALNTKIRDGTDGLDDPIRIKEVLHEIIQRSEFRNPFEGLETQYHQLNYFRKHLNFNVSTST